MSQVPISVKLWVPWSCCVESYNYKKRLEKIDGAEGEIRTRTELPPLDPEPSVSTSSTTSALVKRYDKWYGSPLIHDNYNRFFLLSNKFKKREENA